METDKFPQKILTYCPRCGGSHFRSYGIKANKCGDCGFVFYFNSAAAVAAIIKDSRNRVLLTKRAFEPGKGMLDLPGGFVDPLESAEEALKREILEELHLTITTCSYLGSFPNTYLYGGVVYFTCDLVYKCTVASLDNITACDDVADYEFVYVTESTLEKVGGESIKNILRRFCLAK